MINTGSVGGWAHFGVMAVIRPNLIEPIRLGTSYAITPNQQQFVAPLAHRLFHGSTRVA
jgi:hypothetical protein